MPSRALVGVAPDVANQLQTFAVSLDKLQPSLTTLAPKGWHCRADEYVSGGPILYVYPSSADATFAATADHSFTSAEKYTGPVVRIDADSLGHGPGIDGACRLFTDVAILRQSSNVPNECVLPAGRTVHKLSPSLYEFTDANGAKGIGSLNMTKDWSYDGSWATVTCNPGALTMLCDTIIADFAARNPGRIAS